MSTAESDDALRRGPKVAGFDFAGPRITDGLPRQQACPEIGDPVTIACGAAHGRTKATKACKTLCSVPVAADGKVAGFDLAGWQSADALPAGHACPQRADAVTDACIDAGGRNRYTLGCGVLCSVPVAPNGKVAGFDLTGFKLARALEDGSGCPQLADAVTDACVTAGGRTSYTRQCNVLCSTPVAPK